MTIMWECENCNSSFLEWGEFPSLGTIAYPSTEIISSSVLIHSAKINQLSPNTKYYYRVKTETQTTSLYTFITESNSRDEAAINIIAMSDMQQDWNFPNKFNEINNESMNDSFEKIIMDQNLKTVHFCSKLHNFFKGKNMIFFLRLGLLVFK